MEERVIELRPYQQDLIDKINTAWREGHKNVLAVLPTGGGKTVIMSYVVQQESGSVMICAHRYYIVAQISCTLARWGIYHNIIAPSDTVREIQKLHSYVNTESRIAVSSKDTLIRRPPRVYDLFIQDEAHHVVRNNSWGSIADSGTKALYLTATPERCDGKGLGRQAMGLVDIMVEGITTPELIKLGYLSRYRLIGAKCLVDLKKVRITQGKEFNASDLSQAMSAQGIIGDIVENYKKFANGKLAICFAVSMESCIYLRTSFSISGINAEIINADTPIEERASIMRRFKNHEIKILINVDILGEGADVPEVECVILARPTMSLPVYLQQVGRCLRICEGKQYGIIIDHVGNWSRHGLPDDMRMWSLEGVSRRNKVTIGIKICQNIECMLAYSRAERSCPYCGNEPEKRNRASITEVDGDLIELDPETLKDFKKKIWEFDNIEYIPRNLPRNARVALMRRRKERKVAQHELRQTMTDWISHYRKIGYTKSKIYRTFYLTYGIDMYNAQLLNKRDADLLKEKIWNSLQKKENI